MNNKKIAAIISLVVLATLAGLYFWRSSGDFAFNPTLPRDIEAQFGKAVTYKSKDQTFTAVSPEQLKISEVPIEGVAGGKRILAESQTKAGEGFEVIVLPFDEPGPLTRERILQDLPDMVIKNEKTVGVGGSISALSFDSTDEGVGTTHEVWFVHGGFIYQARTYQSFGDRMEEILKSWKFK